MGQIQVKKSSIEILSDSDLNQVLRGKSIGVHVAWDSEVAGGPFPIMVKTRQMVNHSTVLLCKSITHVNPCTYGQISQSDGRSELINRLTEITDGITLNVYCTQQKREYAVITQCQQSTCWSSRTAMRLCDSDHHNTHKPWYKHPLQTNSTKQAMLNII